ncbi:hypothetical protein U9M48_002147, partial [Paspalum notatum var. saurae]
IHIVLFPGLPSPRPTPAPTRLVPHARRLTSPRRRPPPDLPVPPDLPRGLPRPRRRPPPDLPAPPDLPRGLPRPRRRPPPGLPCRPASRGAGCCLASRAARPVNRCESKFCDSKVAIIYVLMLSKQLMQIGLPQGCLASRAAGTSFLRRIVDRSLRSVLLHLAKYSLWARLWILDDSLQIIYL